MATENQPPSSESIPPSGTLSPGDERTMALLAHLLPLAVGFWAPLVIWLIYREKSAFVNDQAKESLNFQITVFIASLVCAVVAVVTCGIGAVLFIPVVVGAIIYCILAAIQSGKGVWYRYPVSIRFIK